jgi:SAM-dependent methyltransferase
VSNSRRTSGHSSWTREKLDLDLDDPAARADVCADQIAYYGARAQWYDDVYKCTGDYDRGPEANRGWWDELAKIDAALARAPLHGDCVELGAGTGYWAERYVDRVDRIWALDAVPSVLEIARVRLGARAGVVYEVTDLWTWEPDRVWDCAVACFFVEHVPDEVLPGFLSTLHDALRPGAAVFVAEGAAGAVEPPIETREIDRRRFHVVERRRTVAEYEDRFGAAGFEVEATATDHVVWLTATRD